VGSGRRATVREQQVRFARLDRELDPEWAGSVWHILDLYRGVSAGVFGQHVRVESHLQFQEALETEILPSDIGTGEMLDTAGSACGLHQDQSLGANYFV
jgi:hypothetical protein